MKVKLGELAEIRDNEDFAEDMDIEIFEWAVSDGAAVEKGDKMVSVMVGKTSIDVVAPTSGTIRILLEEGEITDPGAVIAEIA